MKARLDRIRYRGGEGRCRLLRVCFYLVLFFTLSVAAGMSSRLFAHGDDASGQVREADEVFNPLAFGIVSGGLVVVGYFMYRIFSGPGKNGGGRRKEG